MEEVGTNRLPEVELRYVVCLDWLNLVLSWLSVCFYVRGLSRRLKGAFRVFKEDMFRNDLESAFLLSMMGSFM